MIRRYEHLRQYPNVFLKMTGLPVAEYEAWRGDVPALYRQAEQERLARPNRQGEPGGGREATLGEGDQILLSVVWLRQYPVHEVLAYLFGMSSPAVSRYLAHVLPVLEQ